MSTLDLKSGYFQLAISPTDIEKTAFITRNGTFAFLRMPLGLSGAAPNFQKAIDIILKPVLGRFVMCYMDDVIITSPSFNEHIDDLNQVFTLLRDAGQTLNKDKCHFARDRLKYLSLIISKEGIETDNNNLIIWKKGRWVTVNIDKVRVYHPRQSDTISLDSNDETLYEGKGSSNGSSRSYPGKSRSSRRPSGDESRSLDESRE
ncbi:retrovirus-related Pol polyprotein from transposon 297 [Trichonephila clavipes]|nr:retrovirus-related Pol polyprotein from transposon 297 [Trichonephila clavipes]